MKRFLMLFFLNTLFLVSFAFAQNLKIGVIDIKKVVNESKYGQEVMKKLQERYNELSKKLQAKAKELDALKKEIETKSSLWSREVREKKQREYEKKLREFRALQEDSQYEMQELQKKLLNPVFDELEKIVKEFIKKEGYDLVFEKNQPGLYYASSKIDLTEKIIKLFDEYYLKHKK